MERLNFFRSETDQDKIRAELYGELEGLLDDDTVRAEFSLNKQGKRIILPSSFIGGPRNMSQLYQDAMALIRKHGRPDLFITFTCNPKWPELCKLEYQLGNILITKFMLYKYINSKNHLGHDRPDLCSRVFNIKLKALMNDLTKKCIFGTVLSYVNEVEFQKVNI